MNAHTVHTRELAAPANRVGALIDRLGSEADPLWPIDRWPTMPFVLDGPLAVGTHGGHGPILQLVDAYEPGRRLVLRFAPGLGLVGTHRLEVEPLGAERSRLTHTLECRVEAKLLPVYPVLIRQHDALVEDLLDRAELAATGRVACPSRWPVPVRLVNAVDVRVARWLGTLPAPASPRLDAAARAGGLLVPAALTAIGALHAAWALGWRWPGGSDSALAERVVGGPEMPPDWATWAVAFALGGAAGVVRATAGPAPSPALRRLTLGLAAVFTLRGTASVPISVLRGTNGAFERLDRTIYSPLCLALGAGAAVVARARPA